MTLLAPFGPAAVGVPATASANHRSPAIAANLHLSGRRLAGFGAAAFALANLHIPGRPATVCPLRALTGIPCPLCGGTTAAVQVGRFDVLGALRANPVVTVGTLMLVVLPLIAAARATPFGARIPVPSKATIAVALTAAVVFSEVWQLFRFGIV